MGGLETNCQGHSVATRGAPPGQGRASVVKAWRADIQFYMWSLQWVRWD